MPRRVVVWSTFGAVCYELVNASYTPISMPAHLTRYPRLRCLNEIVCKASKEEIWIEQMWFEHMSPCAVLYQVFHMILRRVYVSTTERRKLNLYHYYLQTKDMRTRLDDGDEVGEGEELCLGEGEGEHDEQVAHPGGSDTGADDDDDDGGAGAGEGADTAEDMDDDEYAAMTEAERVTLKMYGTPTDTGRLGLVNYCLSDSHGRRYYDMCPMQSTLEALDIGHFHTRVQLVPVCGTN